MTSSDTLLKELVRLWDAGIRPAITKGGHREETDFAQLVLDARNHLRRQATHLLTFGKSAAFVTIPPGFTSDQWGEMNRRFAREHGGDHTDYASAFTLYPERIACGVRYDEELANINGVSILLFAFPDTPISRLEEAERKLRNERDVVRLQVRRFTKVLENYAP